MISRTFLRRDVASELVHGRFSPAWWFSSRGRTEMAVDFYDDSVFKGRHLCRPATGPGPLIVINASDLGGGVRFPFFRNTSTCCARIWRPSRWRVPLPPRRPCRCCLRRLRWRTTPAATRQGAAGCRMHSST